MNATTVAVERAKSVLRLAVAESGWTAIEAHRLRRARFEGVDMREVRGA
jgi:hypothetical protein